MSVSEISNKLGISQGGINHLFKKEGVIKRSISESQYLKKNPSGDPFKAKKLESKEDYFLFGLGLGLYWGEGTKMNKCSVRLGNTDPDLISYFLKFLNRLYQIDIKRVKFGIQIFNDIDPNFAISYWSKKLKTNKKFFYKPVITISNKKGNYTRKVKYGVLTIYFNNKKLRDILNNELEKLRLIN